MKMLLSENVRVYEVCPGSEVELRQDLSASSGITTHARSEPVEYRPKILHAGSLVHSCALRNKHEDPACQCICGHRWLRNFHL